jgi:hypothetical protein
VSGSDWRHGTLDRIRMLIEEADADVSEEAKWVKASNPTGVPTWSHDGIICTGEIYKDKVKVTFLHGASVDDPARLFNASLDAGTRRAIDIVEGSELEEERFKALIRSAVELNVARAADKRRK